MKNTMTYKIYFLNIPLFYVGLQVIWFAVNKKNAQALNLDAL